MNKRSHLFRQVVLTLAILALLGVLAWVSLRLFEPVPVPPIPPPKARAFFDPRADIRKNPLFETLHAVFRGEIEPGPLGRLNPFVPVGVVATSSGGIPSGLGTIREVSLDGGLARALARAKDGSMLVLVERPGSGGARAFEVRRHVPDQEPTVVARWVLPAADPAVSNSGDSFAPVAMRQDAFGKIWLLALGGSIGSIQPDGMPLWNATPVFSAPDSLTSLFGDIQLDGSGRFWVTDGAAVAAGDGTTFQFVDMPAQLSDGERSLLGLTGATPEQARDLLRPWMFAPLVDGRMAVVSQLFAATFPLSLQGRPDIVTVSQASSTPGSISGGSIFGPGKEAFIKMTPDSDLWSVLFDDAGAPRGFARRNASGRREFLDQVVLPKQAQRNMYLMAAGTGGLAALDYAPEATVLWNTAPAGWVAQVLIPASAQPSDTVDRIAVDGQGNVWAILRQKGLLLAQPPQNR